MARGLRDTVPARVRVEHEGEPVGLIEEWAGADAVIVVDAVSSGAAPGRSTASTPRAGPLPAALSHGSTHAFGVAEAVELAPARSAACRSGSASTASRARASPPARS